MSDTTSAPSASARTPAFVAYHVREREGKKAIWTRIGGAWPHKDGNGYDLPIDLVPLDGRITLRVFTEKKD